MGHLRHGPVHAKAKIFTKTIVARLKVRFQFYYDVWHV